MDAILTIPVTDTQVTVVGLKVTLGDTLILRDVNLSVNKGEFLSIVGRSGSGKTTLLNAIANFIPYQGHVEVPGPVGVVFQDHSVFPWMTVIENIEFGLNSSPVAERNELVQNYLKLVELEERGNSYPGELSGGQIQRVGIARAFAASPEVVLMDEPYGSLDYHTRMAMQRWLLDVWTVQNKTIVFVTHDIGEALYLSDRIVVLAGGGIRDEFKVPFERPREQGVKFTSEFIRIEKKVLDCMAQP